MATYRSARRDRQAQTTRADIVHAARTLFAERGYAATSMNDIATAADVAVPTIYASCGSKRELLLALLDLIDAEAGVPELNHRMEEAATALEVIAAGARQTRQLNERCGDIIAALVSAAQVEPDVAAALAEGRRRHRDGTARMAQRLGKLKALRGGVTVKRAAAVIAVTTSSEAYASLTKEHGWTFDSCERWVLQSLSEQLLEEYS
jgi:AcrR family transcriptional regulator